ncbi:MAG: SGNH/GDSL hydrolase family protein [Anaerolineae bacterium]|nr:SGNH/GDSL hydrolase family protein [Anaerolineae bacterium]
MKARIALYVLAAVMLLMTISIVGFNLFRNLYTQAQLQRLDPLNLGFFSTDPLPQPGEGVVRLVIYGDSRAASWPAPQIDGLEVINRGIGAQTTAQVALRFDYHIAPVQPNVILLQMCINDLKIIPLETNLYQSIVDGCLDNVRQVIDAARTINAKVILTTVFPVGIVPLERQFVWSDAVAQAVRDVNAQMAMLTAEEVILFDAYTLLAGADGLIKPHYADDELHLNAAGYAALNEALLPLLSNLIQSIK